MYPRYEQYQDSGVAWLGEVPSHWGIKRLKFAIHYISDKTEAQFSDLRYFGLENIQSFTGKLLDEIELTSEGITHLFQKNDVLFGKLRPYLAKVYLAEQNGLVSTEALVFRSKENIQPKFLFYYCLSPEFIDAVNGTTFGSKMPRASWDDIGNFKIILPPLPEQTAITAFLDCKLVQIDALISKQETLLAKLAEKRTALITHAVTRGLNPAAPLKPSGVAWLGEVPQHWEVKRLRFVLEVNPVKSELNLPDETTVSFIPMDAVNFDKNLTLTQEKSLDEVYKGYTFFRDNDVLLAKITPCFENGKSAIAQNLTNGIGFGTTELHVLRANGQFNNHFLYYLLKTDLFMKLGESQMYGAGGQKRISEEFIKNFSLGIPPLAEQTAIAHYLDTQTAQIDALSNKIRQTIARLQEYRRTLITQAVTGKIKVIGNTDDQYITD